MLSLQRRPRMHGWRGAARVEAACSIGRARATMAMAVRTLFGFGVRSLGLAAFLHWKPWHTKQSGDPFCRKLHVRAPACDADVHRRK